MDFMESIVTRAVTVRMGQTVTKHLVNVMLDVIMDTKRTQVMKITITVPKVEELCIFMTLS